MHAHYYAAITLQYNHEDTVIGRSVQFLLPSYKCTGSGGLQITATRLHDFEMHQITYRILKVFRGWYPGPRRLGLRPKTPVPDWESEKVATLSSTQLKLFTTSLNNKNINKLVLSPYHNNAVLLIQLFFLYSSAAATALMCQRGICRCVLEHSNLGKKFRFDSRYRINFFDSIRQSDKFAACTLIFKQ